MDNVLVSAPGKVVVCGEYAVLDGAPAISIAVDRRASAQVRTASGASCSVTAPGYRQEPAYFAVRQGEIRWAAKAEPVPVVENAWHLAAIDLGSAVDIVLDTEAFTDPATGQKLGLGSSAAVTVALLQALRKYTDSEFDIFRLAVDVHQKLQGARGSGVDVATSIHGGLLEYRMAGGQTRRLAWPSRLQFALFWSGVPASTSARLGLFADKPPQPSRAALGEAAERCAAMWANADGAQLIDVLADYVRVLQRFDIDHGLGIFDAGHGELAGAAPKGVVYKPCGAGGGDVGIAMACSAGAIEDFTEIARARGFTRLSVAMDDHGAEIEREQD